MCLADLHDSRIGFSLMALYHGHWVVIHCFYKITAWLHRMMNINSIIKQINGSLRSQNYRKVDPKIHYILNTLHKFSVGTMTGTFLYSPLNLPTALMGREVAQLLYWQNIQSKKVLPIKLCSMHLKKFQLQK